MPSAYVSRITSLIMRVDKVQTNTMQAVQNKILKNVFHAKLTPGSPNFNLSKNYLTSFLNY